MDSKTNDTATIVQDNDSYDTPHIEIFTLH